MVTMKVFGGEELAKRLRDLPKAVSGPILLAALKVAAEPIRATAAVVVARSPDAPHIAEHMVISLASRRRDGQEASVAIGPSKDQFYGRFLEFGTVHMGAQPFMRPAFDTHGATAQTILGQQLWDAIRKQAGSATNTSTVGGRFG